MSPVLSLSKGGIYSRVAPPRTLTIMATQPAIPAATLVVFRDHPDASPEILIVERAKAMAFAGGMLAFPGGRIDPGDHELAATLGGVDEHLPARIAAIRETIEETGLPVGLTAIPDTQSLARLRAQLHAQVPIGEALAAEALAIAPDVLVPFARWCPNHPHARIFDTMFYLAELPAEAPPASVDATENARLFWASATEALAMCDRGEAAAIFPTRRNLERLAQFGSFADAAAHASATPIVTVTPWVVGEGDARRLHIPEDAGYPVTSEALTTAMRG